MHDRSRLGPEQRRRDLSRLESEVFDVVVIGGGTVGTGSALDAATRGLSVALLEARDFASGTSSRSSKLVHGGLRYLEQKDFGLVREALRERSLLLNTLAPHLVSPVPFMVPLSEWWQRFYIGAGLALYDTLGGHQGLKRHRHLTRRGALKIAPALRKDALVGAIQYYDAKVDDARHTLTVARTAAALGAVVASNARVTGFLREGERVTGVRVRDMAGGHEFDVRAREVVNATGVWTDDVQHLVGERGKFQVRASKGIHLVVPKDRLQLDTGLILRTEKSVLFVIPWGRHWIVGTTDTDWNLDKAHPAASASDIDYVLEHVNAVLNQPLTREDVEGVYAGLRPLLTGESESTSKLSREHMVAVPVPGLVAVAGGKYTTYRVMARDAIDAAARGLDRHVPPSATHVTPLVGADGFQALWNRRGRVAADSGVHVARVEHLLRRYGTMTEELLELIHEDPTLGKPLPGADDYLAVEVRYAASHEGALHLDDVLTRRTRISIETWDRGLEAAEPAARLMAEPLGWDEDTIEREVSLYRERVAAERRSQEQPDDRAADLERLSAPDVFSPAG
ncbi:glycerol-3-phosphate dehydrogenase/oxidase [Solirubrobacter sp. CPCC 204708]|uniref:Glycerol-3-phosphate dehydrogenase n=1 Tax=Solirubrobacter deserti TaxID=2282478 RepID=A0ABT4RV53_9ACTN|nr:glycerol-3-phosphate dehydrogenase/oxidase [Solirubrobacter deserti]MBE2320964.1 glycerol-3-phosphate dehydrogenase/oxidase [Solirubrobacter deserti]MDA0142258.1 glycerol-3-phosphate dehydrogenase/oxidase [Solirubrobacter deserti]